MDLFRLIFKNFKLIIRSKTSILTLILAPVIIIFLLGLAFNTTNIYNIKVSVYSTEYTELSETLLDRLTDKDFTIFKTETSKECVELIKAGESNICLELPPDLSVEKEKTNNIIFHVDPSQTNLVWLILDIISNEIASESEEISLDLTKIILDRLENTKVQLTEKTSLLEELIDANSNLTSLNDEIDKNLGTLDLSYDEDEYDISGLKEKHDSLVVDLFDLESYIEDQVSEGKSNVISGRDAASNSTLIINMFNDIEENLNNIDTKSYKVTLLNKSTLTPISEQIFEIATGLGDIKSRFGTADKNRDKVLNSASESAGLLSLSKENLDSIKATFEELTSGIQSIKISEAGQIVNPITTTIKPVVEERTHLNYIFGGIIVLIIMFVSILLASTVVVMEKKSKSFLINYLAPTRDITFVLSLYFTIMMLMMMQLVVILGISAYYYQAVILSQLGAVSLVLLVATSLFVLIGMLTAYIFKAEQTITLVTISVGSTLLFLSDVILPIESMPLFFQKIVMYNPFLVSEQLLKRIMLFSVSFNRILPDILYLASLSVIIFVLILLNEKLFKRHFLLKVFRRIFR